MDKYRAERSGNPGPPLLFGEETMIYRIYSFEESTYVTHPTATKQHFVESCLAASRELFSDPKVDYWYAGVNEVVEYLVKKCGYAELCVEGEICAPDELVNPRRKKMNPCPFCGGETEQDTVDIGVGMMACDPRGCPSCHSFVVEWEEATPEERKNGCWRRGDLLDEEMPG